MKQNQARFESFPWELEILELETSFDVIDGFLNDEQGKHIYLHKRRFRDENTSQILVTGVQVFRRQMIVLLKTFLEQIIKDFLVNVFIANPEKMGRYLLLEEFQHGKDELEKILQESKITALNELPKSAASRVMKGGLSKILDKLAKISSAKINTHTKTTLVKLNESRTHIVHEASAEEITTEFLHESFESVRDLIISLREVCADNNVLDVDDWEEGNDAFD
jgi:hypothetical protein